jgi:hypothetical protein
MKRNKLLMGLLASTMVCFANAQEVTPATTPSGITNLFGNTQSNNNNTTTSVTNSNTNVAAAPSVSTIKSYNVPTVFVPNLPAGGIDTCLGSSSAGLSVIGFGASGASTWTDQNRVMIKQVTLLSNLGLKDAAVARLLQDKNLKDALLIAYPNFARLVSQDSDE